jgi:hypothetical protein
MMEIVNRIDLSGSFTIDTQDNGQQKRRDCNEI